jgi:translation initiation factor 2B subunit (eIF-2B alpha/beta/delta family)
MSMQHIERRIAAIREDREHGSRWLVRETMMILRDLAQEQGATEEEHMLRLFRYGRELAQARPAMAAIASVVGCVLSVQGGSIAIAQKAQDMLANYESATEQIATHAQPYLKGHLLTCSISGTLLYVLNKNCQSIEHITVLEGRPRYEGRETARTLSNAGRAVTLITDAQAAIFLPHCQGVVVGADSVLADGGVINKTGTALLAWAAQGYEIPFYVLCESLKIAPYSWSDEHLLEEKEPEEVLEQPIAGVTVRNFYFDHTPAHLVTKLITELGILQSQDIRVIADETRQNAQLLQQK